MLQASKEVEAPQQHDRDLVQNMFLHAISTGLLSTTVRNDLKPFLDNPKVSDEVLLEKVNSSASVEVERGRKLGSKSKVTSNLICDGTEQPDHTQAPKMAVTPSAPPKPEKARDGSGFEMTKEGSAVRLCVNEC